VVAVVAVVAVTSTKSQKVIRKLRSRSASALKFLPFGKRVPQKSFHLVCFIVRVFGNTFFLD
jgi:hypothetical protein